MHTEHISSLLALEPYITEVCAQSTPRGVAGWQLLTNSHPSDIAELVEALGKRAQKRLIKKLAMPLLAKTFEQLPHMTQVDVIKMMSDDTAGDVLKHMHADEVVDLLEHLDDDSVQHYLKLIQKKRRLRILSLLNFDSKSAGGIMSSDVLTLHSDMTVKKAIGLLQRIRPDEVEIRYRLYVVDNETCLVGYVTLDTLVTNKPETPIKSLIKENEVVINAHEDQEEAVHKMTHYDISTAPVTDDEGHFLGVILSNDVFEVIEEEASEDVYKMSGVGHVEHTYFETPLLHMFFERGKWLVPLLLFQSVSGQIMSRFDGMLAEHVVIAFFLTMLIGTGGNAGNQSATLVIRGLATGEINRTQGMLVLMREFCIGLLIAASLSAISFGRVLVTNGNPTIATAISLSLFCIVLASMVLGTLIPLILERMGIDPAHSAAPFLATLMDIIGIIIYCSICSAML
ncbi:MAG: magnesium transporter [Candidatus Dependentiae bacterium]|jgi:magnesium transporter